MKIPGYKVEVDSVTESDWSELVGRFADANIYQTWSYGAVRWGKHNLSHVVLKRDGEVAGMAQLRIIRPANLRMGIAYLRWGPLFQTRGKTIDPEVAKNLAAALREEYVGKRGLYLEILPNAFSGSTRAEDRKSTRLNSSHLGISYAVFCLKKKKKQHYRCRRKCV